MDGIGGLVIGHLFRIPDYLLPRGYKGENGIGSKLGYIITGISHNLNGKDWTTGIEAQTIILDEPLGKNIAFKEILKDATISLVSGNVTEAVKELITATPKNKGNNKGLAGEAISAKYGNINFSNSSYSNILFLSVSYKLNQKELISEVFFDTT
jgi:hypothetical protein